MTSKEVLRIFAEAGAIITNDHFVYTSGKHGSVYINKDMLFIDTRRVSRLCEAVAANFSNEDIDVVVGPEKGGIILSQWFAYHHTRYSADVLAVYAEKAGNGFIFRRGYEKLIIGKRVFVIEDIITEGKSVKGVIEAVRSAGGTVVGVAALCNRGGITPGMIGAPSLFSLIQLQLDSWDKASCPLCARGTPINTEVGKGREYLAKKQ